MISGYKHVVLFKIPLTMLLGGVGMGYFGCAYGLFLPIYALSITGLSTAVASLVAKEHGAGQIQNVRKIRRTARLLFAFRIAVHDDLS